MPTQIYDPEQPSYAGGPTYARVPLARIDELTASQVAVVGVPVDEGVSTRPGARYGPRAIRLADDYSGSAEDRYHADLDVHPFAVLDVVDVGDLAVTAGDPQYNLGLAEAAVRRITGAGATPIILGGDHSIARATIAGAAAGADVVPYLLQFDTHADTGVPGPGRPRWAHGAPMHRLVEDGIVPGEHLLQVGLRSWWPGPEAFAWAREHGIRSWRAREIRERGLRAVLDDVLAGIPDDAPLWISFDIDVVDPAFAPGTGTAEPGGLSAGEALDAVLRVSRERKLLGFELVEVSPPYDVADTTAMLAHRLVMEALSAMAFRSVAAGSAGERDAQRLDV